MLLGSAQRHPYYFTNFQMVRTLLHIQPIKIQLSVLSINIKHKLVGVSQLKNRFLKRNTETEIKEKQRPIKLEH